MVQALAGDHGVAESRYAEVDLHDLEIGRLECGCGIAECLYNGARPVRPTVQVHQLVRQQHALCLSEVSQTEFGDFRALRRRLCVCVGALPWQIQDLTMQILATVR